MAADVPDLVEVLGARRVLLARERGDEGDRPVVGDGLLDQADGALWPMASGVIESGGRRCP